MLLHEALDVREEVLEPHLVPRKPLDVVEGFDVRQVLAVKRRQGLQGVVPLALPYNTKATRVIAPTVEF